MVHPTWRFSLLYLISRLLAHGVDMPSTEKTASGRIPVETRQSCYSQFRHYLELSAFSMVGYEAKALDCETHHDYLDVIGSCTRRINSEMQEIPPNNISHWNRTSDTLPDCSYEIVELPNQTLNMTNSTTFTLLKIRAIRCSSRWEKSEGGSSFGLDIKGPCLGKCYVRDNFDDTYNLQCKPCSDLPRLPSFEICRSVTITLDYEHFDAFSERMAFLSFPHDGYDPMRSVILKNQRVCTRVHVLDSDHNVISGAAEDQAVDGDDLAVSSNYTHHKQVNFRYNHRHYSNEHSAIDSAASVTSGSWIRVRKPEELSMTQANSITDRDQLDLEHNAANQTTGGDIVSGYWFINHATIINNEVGSATNDSISISNPDLNQWSSRSKVSDSKFMHVWKWDDPTDTMPFLECVSRQQILMTGSSHMRYNWDSFVGDYRHETDFLIALAGHHTTSPRESEVALKQNEFPIFLKGYIDYYCNDIQWDLRNGRGPAHYTFVLQTGAWSFSYFVPQYVIMTSLDQLLDAIRGMKTNGCAAYIRLVWVTAVPYPHCDPALHDEPTECAGHRFSRNNYAIAAFNERALQELALIDYPQLQVVDAYDIIYTRLEYGEHCHLNHFNCRDGYSGHYVTTPAGRVVVEAIERAICKLATDDLKPS